MKKTISHHAIATSCAVLALLTAPLLFTGCASIAEQHSEQEVLIRELARRPLEQHDRYLLDARYEGSFEQGDGALVLQLTTQTICKDELYDVVEDQRTTRRVITEPLIPLAFGISGSVLAACSTLHAAHIGCMSHPADEETGAPAMPYTRDEDRAAAVSLGLLSVSAFAMVGIDLWRARDSVDVVERREVVRHEETSVCNVSPLPMADVTLHFREETGLASVTLQTDEKGEIRQPLGKAFLSDTVALDASSPGEATFDREFLSIELEPIPEAWRVARAAHFEQTIWDRAATSGEVGDYLTYIERYPQGLHARLAHAFLLPTLLESGRAAPLERYLRAEHALSRADQGRLKARYLSVVAEDFIADYPSFWSDDIAFEQRVTQLLPGALDTISAPLFAWHLEALNQLDATDYDARWINLLTLWKRRGHLSSKILPEVEQELVKHAAANFRAIQQGSIVAPLTPLIKRLDALHAQLATETARQQLASILYLHAEEVARHAIEGGVTEEAKALADHALELAHESQERELITRAQGMRDALADEEATQLLATLSSSMSVEEKVSLLRELMSLRPSAAMATRARLAILDSLSPQLLAYMNQGGDLEDLSRELGQEEVVMSHYRGILLDTIIAHAEEIASEEQGSVLGRVTRWRAALAEGEALCQTAAEEKRFKAAKRRLERDLERSYPLAEVETWARSLEEVLALYPITHDDEGTRDVLERPRKHKGARILISGEVEQRIDGNYLFRTEDGKLLFLRARTDIARDTLKSKRRVALYVTLTGTLPYQRDARTVRVARADVILGARY